MMQKTDVGVIAGKVFLALGAALWLVGAFLFVGNKSGLFTTMPFAGGVTGALGTTVASLGGALIRGENLTIGIEKRGTSPVIVILALLLFIPLLAGSIIVLGDNLESAASATRWIGSVVFFLVSSAVVFSLISELVRQRRARCR
jgi:hypothetical protein